MIERILGLLKKQKQKEHPSDQSLLSRGGVIDTEGEQTTTRILPADPSAQFVLSNERCFETETKHNQQETTESNESVLSTERNNNNNTEGDEMTRIHTSLEQITTDLINDATYVAAASNQTPGKENTVDLAEKKKTEMKIEECPFHQIYQKK
ncbi:unnamed protein product [Mytilus edulis]|uniref:Uncharacterized protein n=1 Tax=Mytilus edulis TaxID=6550 RepID=A0A8S3TRY9_MYTED|nr:unnamed protein product [Mytilus edulis]